MPHSRTISWTRQVVRIGFLSAVLIALASGCGGGGKKPRAVVKGQVTFGDAPVSKGSISFFSVDDPASVGSGEILDGKYEVKDAPIGEVKITVVSAASTIGIGMRPPDPPKGVGGMPANMAPKEEDKKPVRWMPLPEKYKDVTTTDLTYKVEKGEHEYNIPLKP